MTGELHHVRVEQFMVLDDLKVGGTPDRVVDYTGGCYIADIKTGGIECGIVKIAAQLAVYAHANTYNIATGARGEHDADLDRGLIIHLPAGEACCRLYWVDLRAGWEAVQLAGEVRALRRLKFGS